MARRKVIEQSELKRQSCVLIYTHSMNYERRLNALQAIFLGLINAFIEVCLEIYVMLCARQILVKSGGGTIYFF